ncbi:MAG: hypothetical protein WC130_04300 [Kiritimatiellia bacterium]
MKSWGCCDYEAECGCIVFAETRGKARAEAMRHEGFDCSDWADVEVRRLPKLDGLRDTPCALCWTKDARIYYEAGWRGQAEDPVCEVCGLYEYEEFPESHVTETDDGMMCASCLSDSANKVI